MGKSSRVPAQWTIGLDLGDKYSRLCVLDAGGEEVESSRVRTTPEAMRQRFAGMAASRVALEVGTHSPWVQRLIEACGHEVLVANPRKLRMIYQNESKDDEVDAESLARVARMDPKLLRPIRHRGPRAQQDMAVLRSRAALVRARTLLVNHVRGLTKSFGGRVKTCSTGSFARQAVGQVPAELRSALQDVLDLIAALTERIRRYDKQIAGLAGACYPETQLLRQVPGVGALTATSYVLTLEDPRRFRRSRCVGAYLGLRPRRSQSGERDPELRITKAGDTELRRLLVGAAHYILGPFGPDTDLRRWGMGLAARGKKNAKKRAVVAVARKLAVLLHRLWLTGEVYEPLRQSRADKRRHHQAQPVPA